MTHALGIILLSLALSYTGGVFLPQLAVQYGFGSYIAFFILGWLAFEILYSWIRQWLN